MTVHCGPPSSLLFLLVLCVAEPSCSHVTITGLVTTSRSLFQCCWPNDSMNRDTSTSFRADRKLECPFWLLLLLLPDRMLPKSSHFSPFSAERNLETSVYGQNHSQYGLEWVFQLSLLYKCSKLIQLRHIYLPLNNVQRSPLCHVQWSSLWTALVSVPTCWNPIQVPRSSSDSDSCTPKEEVPLSAGLLLCVRSTSILRDLVSRNTWICPR